MEAFARTTEIPYELRNAEKKPLAIVMAITPDFAFSAATVLMGLKAFPPCDEYDVVIYHGGVPTLDLDRLGSIYPCRFIRYHCPDPIRRTIPGDALRSFSDQVYAKYECFALLETYSHVIWLDTDIIIKGDTRGLLERGRQAAAFAQEEKPLRFNFRHDIDGFDMNKRFFNAGIFVLSDRIPGWQNARDWLLQATIEHAENIIMGEQGILNLWLQNSGVEPNNLLPEYNVFRHYPGADTAKIVHAVGHHKPWMDFSDRAWNTNYTTWLAMGGSACPAWKTLLFMARRRPHPLRHPRELIRRIAQIMHFIVHRRRPSHSHSP